MKRDEIEIKQEMSKKREDIRKHAAQEMPTQDFVFKALRADENSYFRRFIKTVTKPHEKPPLRKGNKLKFTVTGKGVEERALKKPQYTKEEKETYSKSQSATLGFPDFHPPVFGFNTRKTELVGIMLFDPEDILLTERNYLYDEGTLRRPYDFENRKEAEKYYKARAGTRLFSKDQLNEFKKAIKDSKHKGKYNEILVRMRWNIKTSKIFIGSDTLESRLWAQEYARILKNHLLSHNLCDKTYEIPICFYTPKNSELHFKTYVAAEQEMDVREANAIYADKTERQRSYKEEDYTCLLNVSPDEVEKVFQEEFQGKNLVLTMLSQGYVHIVQSLLEKVSESKQKELFGTLKKEITDKKHEHLVMDILFYCLQHEDDALADFIFEACEFEKKLWKVNADKNPLYIAAEKGNIKWLKKILLNQSFDVNVVNTALQLAMAGGHLDVMIELLKHPKLDVNLADEYRWTALHYAVRYGHTAMVVALLKHPKIAVNHQNKDGWTALHLAARYGYTDVVIELLKHPTLDVNLPNEDDWTALQLAKRYNHSAVVIELLKHPNIDVYHHDVYGWTALHEAVRYNDGAVVTELLKHLCSRINLADKKDLQALEFAKSKGYAAEVKQLIREHFLENYITKREKGDAYNHTYSYIFGFFGVGVDKKTKLKAANFLKTHDITKDTKIPKEHEEALSEGELGNIFSLLKPS